MVSAIVERSRLHVEIAVLSRVSIAKAAPIASIEAPAMVAASGCAPPMPPRPAVNIQRPASEPP